MEKSLEDYPTIVTIEKTKIIIKQIEKSICKIYCPEGEEGTGFFCYIKNKKNKKLPVFITNNHIIGHKLIKEKQKLKITFNNDEKDADLFLDADKKNIYTNEYYDITIIELKKEEINNNLFLEIDDKVYMEDSNKMFRKKSVYTIQYPKILRASVSYGIINYIDEKNKIMHFCHTSKGSSGSPILNLENNKVIAIHSSNSLEGNYNIGTFLNEPINEFLNIFDEDQFDIIKKMTVDKKIIPKIKVDECPLKINPSAMIDNNIKYPAYNLNKNEIKITLEIQKDEVNKEIYFLGNNIKNDKLHNYLTDLNSENTELLIGGIKRKYQPYFKPSEKGSYEIILKFSIYFNNCSHMFSSCKQIKRIDLSNFKTNEVTDMSYMFYFCTNLKEINLSNLNTKNVKNMSNMFSYCAKLSLIKASSFNIQKVNNMKEMFLNCRNLTSIDFSSSIPSDNLDNSEIFEGCWKIKKLILNKYLEEKFQNEIKELKQHLVEQDLEIKYV